MSTPSKPSSGQEPSDTDVQGLADAIGLKLPYDGAIGVAAGHWSVMIWKRRARPALQEWKGLPIRYSIGGGKPKAL